MSPAMRLLAGVSALAALDATPTAADPAADFFRGRQITIQVGFGPRPLAAPPGTPPDLVQKARADTKA